MYKNTSTTSMLSKFAQQSSLDELLSEQTNAAPATRAEFTVAEYFAGIGLVRLGLERAGWRVVFANDFAREKYEMYAGYFTADEHAYDHKSVFDLDPADVPQSLLATSSFPCIDLSLAGNQNGIHGEHSSAFWGFIDMLRRQGSAKPPLVMLENVPGWLTSNDGKDFRLTLQALNELGYACDIYSLDAIHFTPQSRMRIFVVGAQVDDPNGNIGAIKARSSLLATDALKKAVEANRDLLWNARSIPEPPSREVEALDKIIEQMPSGDSRWWGEEQVAYHLEMMAPAHLARVMELRDKPTTSYRTIYRRKRHGLQRAEVRDSNTAGCLRTARGGSSRQILVKMGNDKIQMRHMTAREYARLQGVPDDYPLPANEIQALTGFGDAVCVPVITWIAKNILNPLADTVLRK